MSTFQSRQRFDPNLRVKQQLDLDCLGFVRSRLKFEPDAKQEEVLTCQGHRVILNCSRQWGKSTVTAARAVWECWKRPFSLVVVSTPTERQSGEFMRKAAGFVRRLGWRAKGDGLNRVSLVMPNGSRMVGVPHNADTIRGFSGVTLLIVDEAARVADEVYESVMPFLATTDGAAWLLSTPKGQRGFFYEAWMQEGEWERIQVQAWDCPRIKHSFLEKQKARNEERFRQEYLCEFVDEGDVVFSRELLDSVFRDDIAEWKR